MCHIIRRMFFYTFVTTLCDVTSHCDVTFIDGYCAIIRIMSSVITSKNLFINIRDQTVTLHLNETLHPPVTLNLLVTLTLSVT
jgi:hypothetical protein